VLEDGLRLAPKAVFGIADSSALGYLVGPRNFAAGLGSTCFRILEEAGYRVVSKAAATAIQPGEGRIDFEWSEGTPTLRKHLRRERSASLREAKKSEFRRKYHGRLFYERCRENPVETYKTADAEACIEVHHARVQVSEMQDGHRTRLEDLQCLCANCHRLAHRQVRKADTPT
jgi:predicted HNH restriction endonuclease